MRTIMAGILGIICVAQTAFAAVGYDAVGRVASYEGTMEQPFTRQDLVWAGLTYAGWQTLHSFQFAGNPLTRFLFPSDRLAAANLALAQTIIVWGANRTAHYRPDATKATIHHALAVVAAKPIPGTVAEVLAQ